MSEADLAAALAKAQAAFPAVHKSKTATVPTKAGSSYTYKYADLADIMAAVRPALADNAIALMQPIMGDELHTVIAGHGAEFRSVMPLNLGGLAPQAVGSLLTYFKRYAVTSMLAVAADDDDDGQAAQDSGVTQNVWQGGTRFPPKAATEKQQKFASKLMADVVHVNLAAQYIEDTVGRAASIEELSTAEMSKLIDALQDAKKAGRTADGALPDGAPW